MKKSLIGLCLGFVLLVSNLFASELDKLTILTEQYPPHNMLNKNGKLVGIATEVLELILKKENSKLSTKDIKVLPWARGYDIVQRKKDTLLYSMVRTTERETMFKWACPIDVSQTGLIAHKSRNIKIKDFKDLDNYKIGTVKNDVGEILLKELGYDLKKVDSLSGTNAIEKSVKKLDSGRIDLFAYVLTQDTWDFEGFDANNYESVYILKSNDLCYAFNLETDDKIIKIFQDEIDKLNRDGTIQKIIDKYKNR